MEKNFFFLPFFFTPEIWNADINIYIYIFSRLHPRVEAPEWIGVCVCDSTITREIGESAGLIRFEIRIRWQGISHPLFQKYETIRAQFPRPFFPFFFLFFIFHPLLRPPFHFVTNNPSLTNGIKTAQSPSPRSIGREKSIRLDFCLLQLNFVFLSRLCSLSLSLFFSGYCFPGARLFSRHFAPPHPPLSRINREKSGCGSRPNNSKIWIECREGMGLSNASKRGLSMKRRVAGTGG